MFIRHLFLTYSTELILLGANFLSGVLLARVLSPGDRGILALVMSMPLTVMAFVHLGLPQASVYLIGREKISPRKVAGNSLGLNLILGILVGVVFFALRGPIGAHLLGGLDARYVTLIAILIPFSLLNTTLLGLLSAYQRFERYNLQRLICTVVQLAGFVGLVWAARGGLAAGIYVFGAVAVLGMVVSAVMARRDLPLQVKIDRQTSGMMLRFGLKSYLQFLFSNLAFRLDLYLIALFLPVEQAAFYSVAVSMAELAWLLPDSAGLVLYPRLTHTDPDKAGDVTARVLRGVVTMTFGIIIALFIIGRWLLPVLYGRVYLQSIPAFMGLLPGILMMSIYKVLARHFTSLGRQKYSIIASGCGLALIVLLDVWLIPVYGIVGAALISSLGYGISGLLLLAFFLRQTRLPLMRCLFLQPQEWNDLATFIRQMPARFFQRGQTAGDFPGTSGRK